MTLRGRISLHRYAKVSAGRRSVAVGDGRVLGTLGLEREGNPVLRHIASLGMDHIRIMLAWSELQPNSTYVRNPPYFAGMGKEPGKVEDIGHVARR